MVQDKNISYLNKNFSDFKSNLTNYAKTYFPTAYNDFSDANPGAMFIEMASYVGDVMSFYLDTQIQENYLLYAKEKENLYSLSYTLGYRPKASYASTATVNIFQLMPSILNGSTSIPDTNYALVIPANTTISSTSTGTKFLTTQQLDFSDTGSATITFYNSSYFLVQKSVPAISATISSTNFTFGDPQKFSTVNISDTNILQVLDINDSNGNKWYEVPYLAQSTIYDKVSNPSSKTDSVPYLMQLRRAPRRFTSRILSDSTLQLEFGAGVSSTIDGNIIPTPDNIQLGLVPGISNLLNNYNQASIFYTQEYGLAPSNTTLTVRYLTGGGVNSNINSGVLTSLNKSNTRFNQINLNNITANYIFESLNTNNNVSAAGGTGGDTLEEIRQNTLAIAASQQRSVTADDYLIRALSMPSDYGSVSKTYIEQPKLTDSQVSTIETLNLYVLSLNATGQLDYANTTLKNNLRTYLSQYRMIGDNIEIRDAFIINIGVDFEIIVLPEYNNSEVLLACITTIQDYFKLDKWQINQPIMLKDLYIMLDKIKGVQSVKDVTISNKAGTTSGYSQYAYDITGATQKQVIYPSLDPSIFEVRYPNTDIKGKVVPL